MPAGSEDGRDSLLRDLGRIDGFLGKINSSERSSSLALVRLVPGMDLKEWNELYSKEEEKGWHAVEISPEQGLMGALLYYLLKDPTPGYRIDTVTGALLAAEFSRRLESEAARARRGRYDLAVGVFSVDNIDRIYAIHGQTAAREALIGLITVMRDTLEPCDTIGRLSGGEYAVIMPGTGTFKFRDVAETILDKYRKKVISSPVGSFSATISAGLAVGHGENTASGLLLNNSLEVMRLAAGDGGNRARVNRRDIHCCREKSVLVCSNEKRFLFSGAD